MIRLPNTGTYSLELITAQNGAQSVVSYSDATSSAYTGGTQVASITSATTTTICSTPAASTVRDVDQINIKNTFAGSHTVTVQVDANGTNYPLIVAALLTDESLNYTHGSGWQVKDANGNTKTSPLTSMTSAQLAAILTDETGSGAAVFANGPTLIAPILGTPASGTVTNLTGTASININGTVGATTPASGAFTTLTSTGNATLGDAEATDTHAIKGATTLLANSASAALTITQTGAGNAFVVEDSASPDSTPFVIDASGQVGVGTTTPIYGLDVYSATSAQLRVAGDSTTAIRSERYSTDNTGPFLIFKKSRGSVAVNSAVATTDILGQVLFQGYGGTNTRSLASIIAAVSAYVSDTDIASYMSFSVSPAGSAAVTERMRITSAGDVAIGTTVSTGSFNRELVIDSVAGQFCGLKLVNNSTGRTSGDGSGIYLNNSTLNIYNWESDSIILSTANAEKLRIASDGTTTLGGTSTAPALSVIPVASQTAWATVTASNGGNPKVGSNTNNLCLGTGSALATSATTGHVCIPTCAGTPTGVPVGAGAGQLPMIYDTTNNFLYIYNGGWKKSTVYA